MEKQIITFSANEQKLQKTSGIDCYASNIVAYIEARFDLGDNWSGYDSVRAVWWNDYNKTVATVLDSDGSCIVPYEVLTRKSAVKVNLVGSIADGDVLTDRLTTCPVVALTIKCNAKTDGDNTQPITPSQYEQFVANVKADADRAETVRDEAEAARDVAVSAKDTAVNAVEGFEDIVDTATATAVQTIRGEGATQVTAIQTEGTTQVASVRTEGSTQVTAVQDKGDEVLDSIPADYTQLSQDVTDLKSELTQIEELTIKSESTTSAVSVTYSTGYMNKSGVVDSSSTSYKYTNKISVSEGDVISGGTFRFVTAFTGDTAVSASGAEYTDEYTVPSGIDGIVISRASSASTDIQKTASNKSNILDDSIAELEGGVNALNDWIYCTNNMATDATIVDNHYYKNSESAESNYLYLKEIPIEPSKSYISSKLARFVSYLDEDKTYISYEQNATSFTTPATARFLNISYAHSVWGNVKLYDSSIAIEDVIPYGKHTVSDSAKEEIYADLPTEIIGGNVLYGKKWYACGDSFTEGDFTGLSGGYTFADEPYLGENKVYPFFIGRRCGMNVVNLAVGGMTMAKVEGHTNNFCESVYQNVGADADYVTLKFGINDGHRSVPIGDISSSDITTFYGAWNTVLTWLITNRPTAKIGIIVSNGLDSADYATATIAIAHKYGLPYLNEWDGEQVPVLIRSGRTDVEGSIKTLRTTTFRVSSSNSHPNVACHEYESTFVETWLRTL